MSDSRVSERRPLGEVRSAPQAGIGLPGQHGSWSARLDQALSLNKDPAVTRGCGIRQLLLTRGIMGPAEDGTGDARWAACGNGGVPLRHPAGCRYRASIHKHGDEGDSWHPKWCRMRSTRTR
jgi:hypothetical protein